MELKSLHSSDYDFIVIGGGVAGTQASLSAAKRGAKTLLVERGLIGGQSSWSGCIPSKALIYAASQVYQRNRSHSFGIPSIPISRDEARGALAYAREMTTQVFSQRDTLTKLEKAEVEVASGAACFLGMDRLQLGERVLRAKHFVIATGSRSKTLEIDGLPSDSFLTNDTLFDLEEVPESLVVIGGGPLGVEMAQAFCRLGSKATIVTASSRLLENEEPELTDALAGFLREEGIAIHFGAEVERVSWAHGVKVLEVRRKAKTFSGMTDRVHFEISAEEIFVAVGRAPNIEGLNLEKANVKTLKNGIWTDEHMRTSNPAIWAVGDVTGSYQYAHIAEYEAKLAVENSLLSADKRRKYSAAPHAIFTDPELARVGRTEEEVRACGLPYRVFRAVFDTDDRALLEGGARGSVKIIAHAQTGRVLGGHLLGLRASELIHELVIAMEHRLTVSDLAKTIRIFPTLSGLIGKASALWDDNADIDAGKSWFNHFFKG